MVTRTFFDKCTTIIQGSKDNFGLNPIGSLNYGPMVSRCLVHFELDNIKKSGFEGNAVKHILKLTNCGSIGGDSFNAEDAPTAGLMERERATSFSIIAFRIPEYWDAGRGFDSSDDFWLIGKKVVSQHGANWYYAYDGKEWGTEIDESGHTTPVEGVVSNETLSNELEKYLRGEESLVIGIQHFDVGNENLNIDITRYVNDVLSEKYQNYGIGLAFVPSLENKAADKIQYVGFFTNHTNTFYQPIVESRLEDAIHDDRYMFFANKVNKLYFRALLDGVPIDLDELPVCTINGAVCLVKRQTTGIYYAQVRIGNDDYPQKTVLYDLWTNLKYRGENFEDYEGEFVLLPHEEYISLGSFNKEEKNLEPSISGINDNEKLSQGDERTLTVTFRTKYSSQFELVNDCQYRLYVKDGKREYDVINWDSINLEGKCNTFQIKTAELLPGNYHIDVRAKIGRDLRIFKNKLCFTVVDNITNIVY